VYSRASRCARDAASFASAAAATWAAAVAAACAFLSVDSRLRLRLDWRMVGRGGGIPLFIQT